MSNSPLTGAANFLSRIAGKALGADTTIEPHLASLFERPPDARSSTDVRWPDEAAPASAETLERDELAAGELAVSRPHADVASLQSRRFTVDAGSRQPRQPHADAGLIRMPPSDRETSDRSIRGPVPTATPHDLPLGAVAALPAEPTAFAGSPLLRPVVATAPHPPPAGRFERDGSSGGSPLPSSDAAIPDLQPRSRGEALPAVRSPKTSRGEPAPFDSLAARRDQRPARAAESSDTATRTAEDGARGALVPSAAPIIERIVVATPAAPDRTRRDVHAERANASVAPTINVTIGRVEVRALAGPAVPKPRDEKRGVRPLSLDDYLKQRRGER
jgi:hypothetical protein